MENIDSIISEKNLVFRIKWLIKLRWWAAAGVFVIIIISKYILQMDLLFIYLYAGNVILFLYNLFFYYLNNRLEQQAVSRKYKKAKTFANIQSLLDLILLTYFIHLSGGPENPFYFYFIFHMVIASIMLSNRAAYLQATLAVFLFGFVLWGEYYGIINHYHLDFIIPERFCFLGHRYFIAIFLVFSSSLYITIYFATSIVNKLRSGEVELEKANRLLEKQDRLKSRYVEVISHDIKASLSTIQSCLKVVLNGLTGSISFKSKEMVGRAEHRSRTLLYYVKGLWNLSQMRTTKKIAKEKIPIFSAVESVITQLRASFETKGLKLKINNPVGNPDVYGNDFLIKELIFNLLQNALKYTLKGGKVTIKIDGTAPSGYISISIMDTGIGIPKESISRIFEDFYRAKNAREIEKDGTGLGLAISKRIIDMHKWKIGVNSEENKGSTFTVTIPGGG